MWSYARGRVEVGCRMQIGWRSDRALVEVEWRNGAGRVEVEGRKGGSMLEIGTGLVEVWWRSAVEVVWRSGASYPSAQTPR